ncbi:MAG TPA: M18 family aminopeptidase [Myxococcales bacterium]|nr:M18 family aminopeptidase [Myxococcales bacterium]HAN31726.1 M18 family aminopeptidase [Myxococcales bacterium]
MAETIADIAVPRQPTDAADKYIRFLTDAVTPFHAVVECENRLKSAGFVRLNPIEPLKIKQGQKAYVVHPDGKTLIAFIVGSRSPLATGFGIWGAHTDSPDLRLRLNPLRSDAGTVLLTTQYHGGIIRRAWLDRPLSLAGSVFQVVRDAKGIPVFSPVDGQPIINRTLVRLDEPLAVIPDLAIHLDRKKNEEGAINPQTMLNAVFATGSDPDQAMKALSLKLGMALDEIDGFDLHLIPWHRPERVGIDGTLIHGPRHDDLAMVFAGLQGLTEASAIDPSPRRTSVGAFFDAEETGSMTASGAQSNFLRDTLLRIARNHPETDQGDPEQSLLRSFVISADMAHALHPNHMDKHDSQHAPLINQGLVIKTNTNDRYATTGETTAFFRALCDVANVPIQAFVTRQDMACGSTIGPINAARLSARTVDIGAPMWGMHSTFETMGAQDMIWTVAAARTFFLGGKSSP